MSEEPTAAPASDAAAKGPVCAHHPDRAADVTCTRCGTFLCSSCREPEASSPYCTECWARLHESRMVAHVPVFAVVLMIHGGLTALMGIGTLVYSISLLYAFGTMPAPAENVPAPVEMVPTVLIAYMLGATVVHLLAGGLQLWAGWRLRGFRGRGLAIGALLSGLLTIVACYCAPSSVAVLVWGAIVLFQGEVAQRFALTAPSAK